MRSETESGSRLRRDVIVLLVLPGVLFAAYIVWKTTGLAPHLLRGDVLITADSPGYMYFSEDRPVGYPLFLALVKLMFGSFAAAPLVQTAAFCLANGLLACSLRARGAGVAPSLALEAALFGNPAVWRQADLIMADCLSSVCFALFAAVVILMVKNARPWMMMALIAITAAAITLRPVNLSLAPAVAVAILVFGSTPAKRALQFFALAFAVLGAHTLTPAAHAWREDGMVSSDPLARGLLQKTLFRQWPASSDADACDGALITRATAPVNEYLARMPEDMSRVLLLRYSGYLRFAVILPQMAAAHGTASAAALDPILMCYVSSRFKADPLYFVSDAARQFWGLLTYATFISPTERARVMQYLETHPPPLLVAPAPLPGEPDLRARAIADLRLPADMLPLDAGRGIEPPSARPPLLTFALQLVQVTAALALACGMFVLLLSGPVSRQRPLMLVVGVCGIAFYIAMLATAVIEIAMPRYIAPFWPLLATALVLSARSFAPSVDAFAPLRRVLLRTSGPGLSVIRGTASQIIRVTRGALDAQAERRSGARR